MLFCCKLNDALSLIKILTMEAGEIGEVPSFQNQKMALASPTGTP